LLPRFLDRPQQQPIDVSDYHKDQTIDTKVLSVLVTTNTAETVQNAFTALNAGIVYEQQSTKAGESSAGDCGSKSRFTEFLLSIFIAEMQNTGRRFDYRR